MTTTDSREFVVDLPDGPQRSQDEEYVVLHWAGDEEPEKLGLHEYARMYSVPGLYEAVVAESLDCRSPQRLVRMMTEEWEALGRPPEEQRVLDVGAGNGMVGEGLAEAGVGHLVGLDLIPEAEEAARRDRPDVFDDYLIADLLDLDPEQVDALRSADFNALTCVAALGFGDIPPAAFASALRFVEDGSLIGFTIKEDFLDDEQAGGFSGFIHEITDAGHFEIRRSERFRHRRAVSGEWLHYVAVIGVKNGPVPQPA